MVSSLNSNKQETTNPFVIQRDKDGNPTGHLMGFFYRSLMFLELGINPIWVFDGKVNEAKKKE